MQISVGNKINFVHLKGNHKKPRRVVLGINVKHANTEWKSRLTNKETGHQSDVSLYHIKEKGRNVHNTQNP